MKILTVDQVIFIHEYLINHFEGSEGILSLPLIESAVYRPFATYNGEDLYGSIFEKAAALFYSLINNHGFVDGNKRTGTIVLTLFIEMNGYRFLVSDDELVELAVRVERKFYTIDTLSAYIKSKSNI